MRLTPILSTVLSVAAITAMLSGAVRAADGPLKSAGPAEGGTNGSSSPEPGINKPSPAPSASKPQVAAPASQASVPKPAVNQ